MVCLRRFVSPIRQLSSKKSNKIINEPVGIMGFRISIKNIYKKE